MKSPDHLGMNEILVITSNDNDGDLQLALRNEPREPIFALENVDRETKADDASFPRLHSVFDYKKMAIILFIYLGAGTICFYFVGHQFSGQKTNKIVDALYITVVSMTSVGYGDLSPDGTLPIVLVSLFSILGMLLIGLVLSKAADYLIEKQEQLLTKTATLEKEIKFGNKFLVLVVLLVVFMVVGTAVLVSVEDLDLIHAFYCINATITTVGSDKCFSTKGGRVFALLWIVSGTVYAGQVFFTFNEIYTQRKQSSLKKEVLQKKITNSDFQAADIDQDGVLKISEYVLHKLKEMGKIGDGDIALILNKFDGRDSNNTESGAHRAVMASNDGDQASSPTAGPSEERTVGLFSQIHKDSIRNRKVGNVLFTYLVTGTICFYFARHQISGKKTNNVLDALYFTVVLLSSVGYGDLTPDTTLAILVATLFAFLGTILMGIFISVVADTLGKEDELPQVEDINHDQKEVAAVKTPMQKHMEYYATILSRCIINVLVLVAHIGIGTAILVPVEDLDFIHALYYVIATITSVGGEKFFSTKGGRIFALLWILNGIHFKGLVLNSLTDIQTQRRRRSLVKEVLERKTTTAELQAADLDDDGVVVAAEFILLKLKETGMIKQEDMAPFIEEFKKLDVSNKQGWVDGLTQRDIGS